MSGKDNRVNLDLIYWVPPGSTAEGDWIPRNAFVGGAEKGEEGKIYVGRAEHDGHFIPCKIKPSKKAAFVGFNQQELQKTSNFEFLCEQTFDWIEASDGDVPPRAVEGGHTLQSEPYYIGRVLHKGQVVIGKIDPSQKCCYIPYQGREIEYAEYEALVLQ